MPGMPPDPLDRSHVAILRFLVNDPGEELVSTPGVIEANIPYAESTVAHAVRDLREWGLVEYVDESRGLYAVTDEGRRVLADDGGGSSA